MLGRGKWCLGIGLAALPFGPGPLGPPMTPEELAKDRMEWMMAHVEHSDVVLQARVGTIRPDSSFLGDLADWSEVLIGTRLGIAPVNKVVVELRDGRALKGASEAPTEVRYTPPIAEAFWNITDVWVTSPLMEDREYVLFCRQQVGALEVTDYLGLRDDPQMPGDISAYLRHGPRPTPRRRTTRSSRSTRLSRRVRGTRRASRRSAERER